MMYLQNARNDQKQKFIALLNTRGPEFRGIKGGQKKPYAVQATVHGAAGGGVQSRLTYRVRRLETSRRSLSSRIEETEISCCDASA